MYTAAALELRAEARPVPVGGFDPVLDGAGWVGHSGANRLVGRRGRSQ
jgi:hypothetical protein